MDNNSCNFAHLLENQTANIVLMKHSTHYFKLLCMLLMVAFGSLQVKAQDPYVEDFSTTTGGYSLATLPEGWGYIGSLSSFERENDKTRSNSSKPAIAINGNTSNYLVTPKLAAGQIGFWLRQYTKSYAASAKLYYCTEKDGEFVIGNQIGKDATLAKGSTTWTTFSFTLDSDSRVAILFSGVFDDFVALNGLATNGGGGNEPDPGKDPEPEPDPEKHLLITAFERTSEGTAVADMNNKFSAAFSITVKNTGNVELSADEVSVSVTSASSEPCTVYATAKAKEPLAVGAEVTMNVEVTGIDAGNGGMKYFYVRENLENTFGKDGNLTRYCYVNVTPYIAKFAIYEEGASREMTSSSAINFGEIYAVATKNFEVRNAGTAPLEVTSITVPKGFTADPTSFTVEAGEKQSLAISLVPQEGVFGEFQGNVVITHNLGEFKFAVSGTVIDPSNIVIDFNDGKIPANWTNNKNFNASSYYKYAYVTSTASELVSPRITIKEGTPLSFKAERSSAYNTPVLTVSYSANGKDWTVAKDFSSELTDAFQTFEVSEIPAGNWFVKFYGKYFDIDDITGFGYCTEPFVTLTISSVGYSTFASEHDVVIPEGVEAYIVTAQPKDDVMKLTAVTGTIAKGEGVIIKGEPDATIVFNLAESAVKSSENILVGTTEATTLEAQSAYILAEQDGQAVFSLCDAGELAAGKAYLPVSDINASPVLRFVFDDATCIQSATEANGHKTRTTAVYNLAGQKVSASYKGIVVKNGTKVMVKSGK